MAASPIQSPVASILSLLGFTAVLVLGAVWTALAVIDGEIGATLARFLVSIGAGVSWLTVQRVLRLPQR